jgi:putative transcriptional regulator
MKRAILLCLVVLAAGLAQAQGTARPLALAAAPGLQGLYSHTTLIAVPVGNVHIGFIVNRATDVKLSALFPGHAPAAKVIDPVHFGGPEMADAIFAVVRGDPGEGSLPLFGGLYLAASVEAIDRVIGQTPNHARYFAGFVGWEPGELEKEIEAGYWHVGDADAALFFEPDTTRLWEELIERLSAPQRGLRAA